MQDDVELIWNIYQEHCEWERHHEEQRASATNVLLAIAAAVLGLITYDQRVGRGDLPLALFLTLQGIYGALFMMKHYERFRMHRERAVGYRKELDVRFPQANLLQIRSAADQRNAENFPTIASLRLNWFWTGVHMLIAGGGLALTAWALMNSHEIS